MVTVATLPAWAELEAESSSSARCRFRVPWWLFPMMKPASDEQGNNMAK